MSGNESATFGQSFKALQDNGMAEQGAGCQTRAAGFWQHRQAGLLVLWLNDDIVCC